MVRLNRKKIEVMQSAEILDVVPVTGWEVKVESGQSLDVSFLYYVAGGRLIQKQLVLFLRGQRKKRAVGNQIIRYLRFVGENSRIVNAQSILAYKKHLDSNLDVSINTKCQVYSMAAGFLKHLMSSGVIEHEQLPKNFKNIKRPPSPSIFELAAKEIRSYVTKESSEIKKVQKEKGIDSEQALILKYGNDVLDAFHKGAIKKIKEWESDCHEIEKIIQSYHDNELLMLSQVSDFRESQGNWKNGILTNRTVEGAIAILYAHFGRLLPPSTSWPLGIADFLKSRDWAVSRLGAAFFNNSSNIQYFLVAALSHRSIAPNVDSVAFYSYLDSFVKGDEIGSVNVFLGKKRGNPVNVTLRANDPLCEVFMNFQKRQRRILAEIPDGTKWLKKERCELFIINSGERGKPFHLKLIDPSSTVNMVRYAAKELSVEYSILRPLIKKITGKSFRPTIVAMDVAEGKTFGHINEKLSHKQLSTTASYAVRAETQSSLELKLRQFHDYLLNTRDVSMERTGTGYFCGIKEEEEVSCKGVEMCFNCEAKRLVLKDSKSISEWLAWAEKIKENMKRLKFNNPERWGNYWMFKLAEYESLLSLCTRSEIDRAKELAIEIGKHLPYLD